MKKFLSFLLVFSVLVMGGCSVPGSTKSTSDKSTLIYGSGDYTRINPALDEHGEINALIFDGLTRHGEGNVVEPALADTWEYDETALTYTFHLRAGVTWHDGQPLTAEDVKFTYEAIMDPANESENAPNYEDVESIDIPDSEHVEFKLNQPDYAFLDYMTMAILPQHLLKGEDFKTSDFFRNPVGTGPYKLTAWDLGQSITLEKNEDYFLGAAKIDRIIFKIVTDDAVRALQLKSGELDLAQVTPKDALTFEGNPDFVEYCMTTSDYRGILYNFANDFWQKNADLIPAIGCAIDRQAILDSVLLGRGEVAYSPLQRNEYNYEDVEKYGYDPVRAAKLLEEAGCRKGDDGFYYRNGDKITFVINATAGDQVRIDMALIAAQQLQALGLDVTAQIPESIDWGGQQCCIIGWGSPFDADDHTYKVFATDKGANYSGYSNAAVDEALIRARRSGDAEVRKEAYRDFQIALADAPAYTFFCYMDAIYMAKKDITGIDPDQVLGHHGVGIFWNVTRWEI